MSFSNRSCIVSSLRTHLAVVDETKLPVRREQDVARVGVAVEGSVYEDLVAVHSAAESRQKAQARTSRQARGTDLLYLTTATAPLSAPEHRCLFLAPS